MGFFDDLFSDEGERPIAKIKGRHCFGFNLSKDATITVELFEDRIVYKNKSVCLSEDKMEDVFSVEGIYKDIDKGSITTDPSHTEFGVMTFTCTITDCSATKTEEIPKLTEHTYGDWQIIKDATVDAEGSRKRFAPAEMRSWKQSPSFLR